MLIDYHTHLERGPYTLEYVQRFVDIGRERGVSEICFTEHGHLFYESYMFLNNDWPLSIPRRHLVDYINLVEQAKGMGLPVKLGLEMDYIPQTKAQTGKFLSAQPFDFVLGSVHWIDGFGFDNPDWLDQWDARSVEDLYCRYFVLLREAVQSKMFDAIAHPDVIKIFGHRPSFSLLEEYRQVADSLADNGVCLEVSTAGWRKPVNELYPHLDFLKTCLERGVNITLASDAHEPAHVGCEFDRAVSLLRDIGVKQLATFTNRQIKIVKL
ncbi:MAG: histidinol-phosphatase HisJ family protein [Bacillota bacterium]|nr:histidinol-phosphatase HisJ family protein [Bacillota bacterium]